MVENYENLLMKKAKPMEGTDCASKRKQPEKENREVVGGVRNPIKIGVKNPHRINAGRRIRRCVEEALMDNEAANVVDGLDKDYGGTVARVHWACWRSGPLTQRIHTERFS